MSWNINDRKAFCGSLNFLQQEFMRHPLLKKLADYYHTELVNKKIVLDKFIDSRLSNYYANIPAYTDALVNLTNETFSQTCADGVQLPGPYISDKTWKPLIAGCAMMPQGPSGIYSYLEEMGFVFDYPWDKTFDENINDFDRFLHFLTVVDDIFLMDKQTLANSIAQSCEYNYNYIRSAQFKNRIQQLNQDSIGNFLADY